MESALITSPSTARATRSDNSDLPAAVGPTTAINGRGMTFSLAERSPRPRRSDNGGPLMLPARHQRSTVVAGWQGDRAVGPDGSVWPCVFARWLPVGNHAGGAGSGSPASLADAGRAGDVREEG